MKNNFSKIINNNVNLNNLDKFAAIIGSQPSKGARSPILWNSAFKAHGLNYLMLSLDVEKDNLFKLLESLNSDIDFIGGAITTPHKISVAKWLGNKITKEAAKIGAVNCLFRNEKGELLGTNTDGEAAVLSFEKICNENYVFDLRGYINKEILNLNIKNIENIEKDTFSEVEFFYSYRRSSLYKKKDYGRCISVILMT